MYDVLVGVDGSDGSRVALRWAAGLAARLNLPLRAVWAWQYPADATLSFGEMDLPSPERADELIEHQMQHLLADVLGEAAAAVTTTVGRGPAAGALLRAADDRPPEMIVVGTRGLGGFRGLLLGSVSRQLCEHAPYPVTVVPHATPTSPARFETIVAGIDGSDDGARALTYASRLAVTCGADLVVAHATGPGEVVHPRGVELHVDLDVRRDLVEEWCQPLRDADTPYRVAVIEGDARTALLDVTDRRGADLLVVGSRGHGTVARLVLGSVASGLVHHTHVPVTVVPRPR
jgi:nucleotide-binding universal stress UspA family protein